VSLHPLSRWPQEAPLKRARKISHHFKFEILNNLTDAAINIGGFQAFLILIQSHNFSIPKF
jgi:hypothetical protein